MLRVVPPVEPWQAVALAVAWIILSSRIPRFVASRMLATSHSQPQRVSTGVGSDDADVAGSERSSKRWLALVDFDNDEESHEHLKGVLLGHHDS